MQLCSIPQATKNRQIKLWRDVSEKTGNELTTVIGRMMLLACSLRVGDGSTIGRSMIMNPTRTEIFKFLESLNVRTAAYLISRECHSSQFNSLRQIARLDFARHSSIAS